MKTLLKKLDSLKATQKRIAELEVALKNNGYNRETGTFDPDLRDAWLANYEERKKQGQEMAAQQFRQQTEENREKVRDYVANLVKEQCTHAP